MDLDKDSNFDEKFEKNYNKDNFKNAICYIPLVAVVLFFTENNKTPELNKNIKYWTFLLIVYVLLNAFVWFWVFRWLIVIIYLWVSWFLWYKAYSWEKIEIEVIDKIEKNVKEKMNNNNTNNNTENKTETPTNTDNKNEL